MRPDYIQIEKHSKILGLRFSEALNGQHLARHAYSKKKEIRVNTLYACLGSGNCFKPWLLAQQLEIDLEVALIDVLNGEQKSDHYLEINPLGVVPFLVTKTDTGIGESNAMLWYLGDGSDMIPNSAEEQAEALQWMFFEQSKLEPYISPARFFTTILPDQKDARMNDIVAWCDAAKAGLSRLNDHLKAREFMLASGYSITDIAIYGYVHLIEEAGLNFDDYPAIKRWCDTISQTKNYRPISELGQSMKQAA